MQNPYGYFWAYVFVHLLSNRATLRWKIRKYETLFAMALIKGCPQNTLGMDIIFQPGMDKFAAQTQKSIICQQEVAIL